MRQHESVDAYIHAADRQTDGQAGRQTATGGRANKQTDRKATRQTDGQTDRQMETQACINSFILQSAFVHSRIDCAVVHADFACKQSSWHEIYTGAGLKDTSLLDLLSDRYLVRKELKKLLDKDAWPLHLLFEEFLFAVCTCLQ